MKYFVSVCDYVMLRYGRPTFPYILIFNLSMPTQSPNASLPKMLQTFPSLLSLKVH